MGAATVAYDPALRIGYVDGGSDLVYEGLRRIGMDVTLLSDSDLASGDLNEHRADWMARRSSITSIRTT